MYSLIDKDYYCNKCGALLEQWGCPYCSGDILTWRFKCNQVK